MLRISFSIIVFIVTLTDSTVDVFIFWGYPNDGTDGCVSTTAASFDDCVTACDTSTTCMLSYGNDTSCMLCDMFLVTSITQSNSEKGIKTAVKVDTPDDGCPSDMESDEYTRTDTNDAYNLTYSAGTWTITYENKSCEDDTWKKFYRPLGQWCMKVFGNSSLLTKTSASATCVSLKANTSAIQSADEIDFITSSAKNLSGSLSKYTYTAVWMDGVRYGTCNFDGAENTAACAGIKMFSLSDPYLSSTSQYTFVPNQPDSVADRGSRHNCISLLVAQSQSAYQGLTYNALCTYTCNADSTECSTDVFIFWGYPTDVTDKCVSGSTGSFTDCVSSCSNSITCMLAFGNDNECKLCDMFIVSKIAQSDEENGMKTAVKVNSPDSECPSDMGNQNYSRTDTNDHYNVSYQNGIWSIDYEIKDCPDLTWTKFKRPLGQWCMKVFGNSTIIAQSDIRLECQSMSGWLSGIQSKSSRLPDNEMKLAYSGVWMNGQRKDECNREEAERTVPGCAGIGMFTLTDPYLSSTDQYKFIDNQPDSVVDRGIRHNCLAILVQPSKALYDGRTYNALCTYACDSRGSICMTNYVCGKPAE